ncbi:hypothetical protein ASE63_21010 [Bosea sp. Root381]|nr:hypothetical protein ASE63_21010 [Bosea sp. Root381]
MQNQGSGRNDVQYFFLISSEHGYREALSRIRVLDGAKAKSPEEHERDALELAVSRYLMGAEPRTH